MVTDPHYLTAVSSFQRVRCPRCRRVNEGHVGSGRPGRAAAPKDGDVSICWHCHGVNIFGTNLEGRMILRLPTNTEAAELQNVPEVRRARAAVAEAETMLEAAGLFRHMSLMDGPDGNPSDTPTDAA